MKCPSCQAEISKDARFCGECGKVVPKVAPEGPDLSGLRTIDDMETRSPRADAPRVMQPGEVFATRYEIANVIGEGGMGVVYRAHDKLTEKDVALKLIRADRLAGKDAVKRLIREGVTSRDIRHANVVAVYDVGEAAGQPYMSMEFLGGQSLRQWNRKRMQSSTDCSMKTAANVIAEILAGLEAAHKAGVVHRDLKPENVMLLSEPNDQGASLKILDFGVARAAGIGDTGATSLGTRGYMAPEQITAPDAAQPSADLYSLSVMFYELLVGVVPQGHWQPPSGGRSDVPPAIDKLIERGLANNPRVRPQNVAEYGRALAEAMRPALGNQSNPFAQWLEKIEQTGFKPIVDNIKHTFDNSGANSGGQSGGQHSPPPPPPPPPSRDGVDGKNMGTQWKWTVAAFTANYANGKGRASRMEYWCVISIGVVVLFAALSADIGIFKGVLMNEYMQGTSSIDASMLTDGQLGYLLGLALGAGLYFPPVLVVSALALAAPTAAATSRRLHDMDKPAGIAWIAGIPVLGQVLCLFWGLQRGTVGDNRYGPDPLGGVRG